MDVGAAIVANGTATGQSRAIGWEFGEGQRQREHCRKEIGEIVPSVLRSILLSTLRTDEVLVE